MRYFVNMTDKLTHADKLAEMSNDIITLQWQIVCHSLMFTEWKTLPGGMMMLSNLQK